MMNWRAGPRVRMLAASVAMAAGLAACGGGSSGSSNPKLVAACKDNVDINDGFSQLFSKIGGPPEGPPSPEVIAQIKVAFPQALGGPLDNVDKDAPDAIKGDVNKATAQLRKFGATGDGSFFDTPEWKARNSKIDNYFFDNCAGPKQTVTATDYKFKGLPDKLPAGVVQLKLTNSGKEEHEILVLRRKPGVTESFDQILALPREQGMTKAEAVTEVSASPGKTDATAASLTPGKYVVICTFSKGTVGDKRGDGPPHFTMGMKQEITVS